MNIKTCSHLTEIKEPKKGNSYECSECVQNGDTWVHLRTCQTCGVTLCCDSSPNKHASRHFRERGHEVIASAEPGEKWLWCYQDELFIKY